MHNGTAATKICVSLPFAYSLFNQVSKTKTYTAIMHIPSAALLLLIPATWAVAIPASDSVSEIVETVADLTNPSIAAIQKENTHVYRNVSSTAEESQSPDVVADLIANIEQSLEDASAQIKALIGEKKAELEQEIEKIRGDFINIYKEIEGFFKMNFRTRSLIYRDVVEAADESQRAQDLASAITDSEIITRRGLVDDLVDELNKIKEGIKIKKELVNEEIIQFRYEIEQTLKALFKRDLTNDPNAIKDKIYGVIGQLSDTTLELFDEIGNTVDNALLWVANIITAIDDSLTKHDHYLAPDGNGPPTQFDVGETAEKTQTRDVEIIAGREFPDDLNNVLQELEHSTKEFKKQFGKSLTDLTTQLEAVYTKLVTSVREIRSG